MNLNLNIMKNLICKINVTVLNQGWIFCTRLNDFVKFLMTENVKHVSGYASKPHCLQTIVQTGACLEHKKHTLYG